MPPIVLKIEGNESLFSNLNQDELEKTWRVCTKVKDSLENGSRLENLSWRLWFIQNVSNDVKSHNNNNNNNNNNNENSGEVSVLDYSLDEIKPVGTENFTLNQFTSDQEGDQMIELKDLFPIEMQDFMFAVPGQDPLSETQFDCNTTSSWQPTYDYSQHYAQSLLDTPQVVDQINMPIENLMQQQPNIVDYSTYFATALPNATLHNKLLATLPRQTLESAERLLSSNKRPQQTVDPPMKDNDQHYYNTFQLDPTLASTHTASNNYGQTDEKPLCCSNCETTTTPLWRRSANDKVLCNACGL